MAQGIEDQLGKQLGPAARADHGRRCSQDSEHQPPIVRPVRHPDHQGHRVNRLPAPMKQSLDCEDASQGNHCLGRRDPERDASTLKSPFRDPHGVRELRHGAGADCQIQRVLEYVSDTGINGFLHSRQQVVSELGVNATQDRRGDSLRMIFDVRPQARR